MNPGIGKRSTHNFQKKKTTAKVVEFIYRNTKKSITLKQEYLYLDDVKTAMNIHHLETNINLKKRMMKLIEEKNSLEKLMTIIETSAEKDRHRLQKMYNIKL